MLRTMRIGLVAAAFVLFAVGCTVKDSTKNDDDMANQANMAQADDDMNTSDDMATDDAAMDDDMGMDDDGMGMAEGKVCGGIQGLPCDEGQFCEFEPGNCSSADLQGMCVDVPEICTKEYKPVCGCDGKTYGNDCERRAASVQKDHDGECKAA